MFAPLLRAPRSLLTTLLLLAAAPLSAQQPAEARIPYRTASGQTVYLLAHADADGDGIENHLEINGFQVDSLTPVPCSGAADCFHTDPRSWSTDQDPYSDFDEATGEGMPTTILPPYNHPLVAARPLIVVGLLNYTVTPINEITNSEGFSTSSSWQNVTTSQHEAGGSISAGYGLSPFKAVSVQAEAHYSYTHTSTTTTTRDESYDYSKTTTSEPQRAAELKLEVYYENLGSAPALEVAPTFNILIGGRVVETYTATKPNEISTEMGVPSTSTSRFPAGVRGIVIGGDSEIVLTLDEVQALAAGAPLALEVVQIAAKIVRTNQGGLWGECGSDLSCSWSTFQSNMEGSSLILNVDIGDDAREFYVYAGNQYDDPDLRLRDALGLALDLEERGPDTYVDGIRFPDDWFVSTPSASLLAAYDDSAPLSTPVGSFQRLFLSAPGPDPGPEVRLASYTPDLRDVVVAPVARGAFPIWKVEAYFTGRPEPVALQPASDGLYYRLPGADTLLTSGFNYVVVTDAAGFEARASITRPAFNESCEDATIHLSASEKDAQRPYPIFFEGDPEKPIAVWCDFATSPAREIHARRHSFDDDRALYDVHFADRDHGALVGEDGWAGLTSDGGLTFERASTGIASHLYDVHLTDARTLHVVGSARDDATQANYASSTDGGATWTSRNIGTKWSIVGLDFLDAQTGVAVGSHGTLFTTADGGATWTPRDPNTAFHLRDVDVVSATFGVAVGYSGRIIRSRGDLQTWGSQLVGGSNPHLQGVSFVDEHTGLAVGDGGSIFKTTDGALTWQPRASGTTQPLYSVRFVSPAVAVAVGHGNTVLRSLDGGESWAPMAGVPTFTSYTFQGYSLHAHDANSLYIAGLLDSHRAVEDLGYVIDTRSAFGAPVVTNPVLVGTGPPEALPHAADAPVLQQNAPNPFQHRTTIRYRLARPGPATLRVYDLTGRLVATLTDAILPAGAHEATFDASGLASGLYFYRLEADASVQSRTMAVLR